jgi:hypothetical protein
MVGGRDRGGRAGLGALCRMRSTPPRRPPPAPPPSLRPRWTLPPRPPSKPSCRRPSFPLQRTNRQRAVHHQVKGVVAADRQLRDVGGLRSRGVGGAQWVGAHCRCSTVGVCCPGGGGDTAGHVRSPRARPARARRARVGVAGAGAVARQRGSARRGGRPRPRQLEARCVFTCSRAPSGARGPELLANVRSRGMLEKVSPIPWLAADAAAPKKSW